MKCSGLNGWLNKIVVSFCTFEGYILKRSFTQHCKVITHIGPKMQCRAIKCHYEFRKLRLSWYTSSSTHSSTSLVRMWWRSPSTMGKESLSTLFLPSKHRGRTQKFLSIITHSITRGGESGGPTGKTLHFPCKKYTKCQNSNQFKGSESLSPTYVPGSDPITYIAKIATQMPLSPINYTLLLYLYFIFIYFSTTFYTNPPEHEAILTFRVR